MIMKKIVLLLTVIVCMFGSTDAQNKIVKTEATNVTVGYLPKLSTVGGINDLINNSLIYDNGYKIGVGTTAPVSLFSVGSPNQFQVNASGAIVNSTGIKSSGTIIFTSLTGMLKGNGSSGLTAITGTANYLPKWSNSTTLSASSLIFDNGSAVGINTASPTSTFTVNGNGYFGDGGSLGVRIGFDMLNAEAGITDENRVIAGRWNNLYVFGSIGNGTNSGIIVNAANDNVGICTITPGSKLQISGGVAIGYTASTSAPTNGLLVDGIVGIGTTTPDAAYKLSVNGKIRAKEVVVETGWSDFVFDANYILKPLSEVEQYIKSFKHLPDVPSAEEIQQNGVSLGQSDAILLQKIEELTLYVIEQNKMLAAQQQKILELEQKVSNLK